MSTGDTSALLNEWYKLGGNRTKLAEALRKGASKPEKKIGFLSALKKIYKNNGIGAVDDGGVVVTAPVNAGIPTTTTPVDYSKAQAEATKALENYALTGNAKALITALSATAGGVIGTLVTAGGGPLAVAGASIGTGAGGVLGQVIIALTKVIKKAVDKTPDTDLPLMPVAPPSTPLKAGNTMLYVGGALLVGAGIYFATKKK